MGKPSRSKKAKVTAAPNRKAARLDAILTVARKFGWKDGDGVDAALLALDKAGVTLSPHAQAVRDAEDAEARLAIAGYSHRLLLQPSRTLAGVLIRGLRKAYQQVDHAGLPRRPSGATTAWTCGRRRR